jgi:hypothetical protein
MGIKEGSGSFLQKRTKKLWLWGGRVDLTRTPNRQSFCFFFQKEALTWFS